MCYGQDGNVARESDKDNLIREIVDRETSHIGVADARHDSAGPRELLQMMKCLPDFACKSFSDFATAIAIPRRDLAQLATCSWTKTYTRQRDCTSL